RLSAAKAAAPDKSAAIRANGAAMRAKLMQAPRDRLPALDAPGGQAGFALADAQRRADVHRDIERARNRLFADGDVAHLAARPRLALAIKMQVRPGMSKHGLPVGFSRAPDVAQEVHHDRRRVLRRIA